MKRYTISDRANGYLVDEPALQIFVSLNLNEFGVHRRSAAGKYTSSAPLNGCTVICKA